MIPGFEFYTELDKLKSIERRSLIYSGGRLENSAEHSWHLAMMVLTFSHLADQPFNLEKAMKLALIHDIVEIDAGDTFLYDEKGKQDKFEREKKAADRLFGLTEEHGAEFKELWLEYENKSSYESVFVHAIDRIQPLTSNFLNEGHSWNQHGIIESQVREKLGTMKEEVPRLYELADQLISQSVEKGYLKS